MCKYVHCITVLFKIGYKMAVTVLKKHCIDEIYQGFSCLCFTFKFNFQNHFKIICLIKMH